MGEAFKAACTHLEGRPTAPYSGPGGRISCLLPRLISFPPLLREGVAAE
jgi:hypothetical protein